MNDLISRQAAIDAVHRNYDTIIDFRSDGETVATSVEDILIMLPSAQPLSEIDLIELRDRFGEYVRYVVEDMLSGKGERWEK